MKNPFNDFHPGQYQKREDNVERILLANQDILEDIVGGYLSVVEKEIENLAWIVEHDHVVEVYSAISARIRHLRYNAYAIEAFCSELDSSRNVAYLAPGPAGLYISALVNYCREKRVVLKVRNYRRKFHFLGYGLPKGRTLIVDGDVGDFSGVGLYGGALIVQGSAGDWCGAGMVDGKILVTGNTGNQTGQWMHGGEIRVDGSIKNTGETRFNGTIYMAGKPVPFERSGSEIS